MADTDVWALSSIGSPAATDRIPIATGSGAGGYSLRGEFLWVNNSGNVGLGEAAPAAKFHVKSSGGMVRLETTTVRGSGSCYQGFYDPTGEKGFVGYAGGNDDFFLYNSMSARLIFGVSNLAVWQILSSGNFGPIADNTYDLASAGERIRNSFFAVSPTVTSDERGKTWHGAPNAAELRAAKRIIAELGFYQWNDAIAEKGADGARYHFGVRAQQVWAILADEELIDPLDDEVTPDCKYAFLCWDEWDAIEPVEAVEEERDEDDNIIVHAQPAQPGREAGNRFGVRSDQLTMFLIAAQEARLAALEAAL